MGTQCEAGQWFQSVAGGHQMEPWRHPLGEQWNPAGGISGTCVHLLCATQCLTDGRMFSHWKWYLGSIWTICGGGVVTTAGLPNDNRARLGCCQRSRASVKYVQTTHQWRNTCSVQNRWSWMKSTLHCNTRAHPCNYINTLSEGFPLSTHKHFIWGKWFRSFVQQWKWYCKCIEN